MQQWKNGKIWVAIILMLLTTALLLHENGRLWICSCNKIYLWVGNAWSSDNSQHIFDPYSFSHFQHGMIFLGLLYWIFKKISIQWLLAIAVLFECGWELLENSPIIINRYREGTAALGYNGDTVLNSIMDIICCMLGFIVTFYMKRYVAVILFIVIEVVMIWWIRDSFLLNVLMLVYPIQAIKNFQVQ